MMMSPPTEAVMRKLQRAGDPVRAMEGGGSMLVAYTMNRIRLKKDVLASNLNIKFKITCKYSASESKSVKPCVGFLFHSYLKSWRRIWTSRFSNMKIDRLLF